MGESITANDKRVFLFVKPVQALRLFWLDFREQMAEILMPEFANVRQAAFFLSNRAGGEPKFELAKSQDERIFTLPD